MSFTYDYPRPALTVDVVLITNDSQPKVLLIQRKNNPFKDCWAFPGGFMDMDETLETAAYRELKEETHITVTELQHLGIYDAISRDPRGRTISAVYYKQVEECIPATADDDAKNVHWFPVSQLPGLAFDHEKIITDLLKKLDIKH